MIQIAQVSYRPNARTSLAIGRLRQTFTFTFLFFFKQVFLRQIYVPQELTVVVLLMLSHCCTQSICALNS